MPPAAVSVNDSSSRKDINRKDFPCTASCKGLIHSTVACCRQQRCQNADHVQLRVHFCNNLHVWGLRQPCIVNASQDLAVWQSFGATCRLLNGAVCQSALQRWWTVHVLRFLEDVPATHVVMPCSCCPAATCCRYLHEKNIVHGDLVRHKECM